MNDDLERELVSALLEVRRLHPHWRFGQLVENVAAWSGADRPARAWDVSDEDLLRAAREHLRNHHVPATGDAPAA